MNTIDIRENDHASTSFDATHSVHLMPTSPFRTPDWRWRRACHLTRTKERRRRWDDERIVRARGFLFALARVGGDVRRPGLARHHLDVLGAYLLYTGVPRRRWELEARLLAGQDDEEIGRQIGVAAGVVAAYESLFFDVRTRLGASDWVAACAIGPRLYSGFDADDREVIWKLLAYQGGPLVLDALIAHVHRGDNPRIAGPIDLLIKVMTTAETPEIAVGFLRVHVLNRHLERSESARNVAPVTKSIVLPPIEVHFGPETVPMVRVQCASEGSNEADRDPEGGLTRLSDAG